jgi:hypothetical protein
MVNGGCTEILAMIRERANGASDAGADAGADMRILEKRKC